MAHHDNGGFSGRRIVNLPAQTAAGHLTHFLLPLLMLLPPFFVIE
jgi:hypothetical protein